MSNDIKSAKEIIEQMIKNGELPKIDILTLPRPPTTK